MMDDFNPHMRKYKDGRQEIFDIIRKKFVAFTPEEGVRQQLLHYLTTVKKFPEGLLLVEAAITYNKRLFRADVVAYDRCVKPLLIAECKAPQVHITQETFEQVARYNLVLKVPYLLVTNGQQHFFCRLDLQKGGYVFEEEMADYDKLSSRPV
jgi:type I site-specific restriction endonuclease